MKKTLLAVVAMMAACVAQAADITGKWRTIDDASGKPKAEVLISQSGSQFNGKIVGLAQGVENVCPACGDNKPLVGLTVLTGLKSKGNGSYEGGKIYDPKSGKTYSAKAEVSADGKTLKVRGYLGVSLLGRTQVWQRIQ